MSDLLVVGGKLALICTVAALALGLVNAVTEPKIEEVKVRQLEAAIADVSRGGTVGAASLVTDDKTVTTYYPLSGKTEGYVVRLIGIGYGGEMVILASYSKAGDIIAVSLMDNLETPGLGKKAESPEYMSKFIGRGTSTAIPSSKQELSQQETDSISGATITFLGVADALRAGSVFVLALGGRS